MATAASDKNGRQSPTWDRPDFSIQRMVLLGNNWCERSLVGNLILGKPVFDTETEPQQSQLHNNKEITVINTPDLLQPDLPAHRLTELIAEIADASAPGPHVFLVVLQPEEFTEQQKNSLHSILERFSEKAFHHSLLLISTPHIEMAGCRHKNHQQIQDMIRFCKYRYLYWFNLGQEELMTRLEQLMKENNGEHVVLKYSHQTQHPAHFRIVLFGENEETKQALITSITGSKGRVQDFSKPFHRTKNKMEDYEGKWKGNKIKVVKTPNLSTLSVAAVRECVSLCSPGPNVLLLLLVKSSDFTKENRETLNLILSLFGPDVFKHCMVVHGDKDGDKCQTCVNDLISDCESRSYKNKATAKRDEFMKEIENIVTKNKGAYLSLCVDRRSNKKQTKPSLNLVLCGRGEAEKTSVVKSMLGRAELSTASPGQCVKHEGEVCGRWVSLVKLPSLSGKPLETVMQQCLSCMSLCAPEGVHAFILVLPLGPLTDEDKAELKTLQDTLSSGVLPLLVIVDTVEPTAVKGDRDIQELSQSCGGEYLIFSTRKQQQVSELLGHIENKPHSFTTEMFLEGQIKNYVELFKELKGMKTEQTITCDEKQNPDCLRIVLIGKTGSGKSSSGNTILGRKVFKSESSQVSVTSLCEKAETEVDGRHVAVVDTPGLFDTKMSNEYILDEMLRCVSLLAPGPHVFLVVVSIGRFTNEEKETLKHIKSGFGKGAQMFTIILLTHGDDLEADNLSIENFIRDKCDDSFKKLISDCGNRYHVFNNRKEDRTQVKELLRKIDLMVKKNGGGCYTNKMLQEAEAAIKKEMERIMKEKEEEMKRERELLESKYNQEVEQMKQQIEEQKNEIEKERNQREKELKEKEEKIKEEQQLRKREKEQREADDRKKKAEEEKERREWEQKQKDLEEKIKSEEESKETTDRKLQETRKQMEQDREKGENERQKLEEKHHKEVEQLRRTFEEEARRKAELNYFKDNKEAKIKTLLGQHIEEMKGLEKQYEGEIGDMGILLLSQKKENKEKMDSLKKQHAIQLKKKEEDIKYKFNTEEKNKTMQLKQKQKNEMDELAFKLRRKQKPTEKRQELCIKHEIEINELKKTLLEGQMQDLKAEITKLKKKQEYTQTILEENQKTEKELLEKLQTKHDQEMKKLRERTQSKEICREELEELQKKRDNEFKEFKEKLLTPEEKSCIVS